MRWLAAGCAIFLMTGIMAGQSKKAALHPGKIFVGSTGSGEDADQFRLALGYELGRAGFKVVDFEGQADTVLTALIVTRVEEGKSAKRVTTFLKDRKTGKMIWNQDFGSDYAESRSSAGILRVRAQQIAKALKSDSAGRKTATE